MHRYILIEIEMRIVDALEWMPLMVKRDLSPKGFGLNFSFTSE